MAVKVDDGDRTVGLVHAAKQRQRDCVVASHCDHARQGSTVLRWADFFCVGRRVAHENAVVTFLDLVDGPCIIVSSLSSVELSATMLIWTHEVTGMSPQSNTFAQSWNGFAARGTLYPPLNRTFREPLSNPHL